MSPRVLLYTADQNKGKTTYVQRALESGQWQQLRVAGILSLANTEKSEYTLLSVTSGEQRVALSADCSLGPERFGRFSISHDAYRWANNEILMNLPSAELLLFDEIGKLELAGWGFSPSFSAALMAAEGTIVATVRTAYLEAVRTHFGIDEAVVRRVDYE